MPPLSMSRVVHHHVRNAALDRVNRSGSVEARFLERIESWHAPSPYPLELRERAVRMVAEVRADYPTEWAAMKSVAAKLGIGTAETLRNWVRQAEVDAGRRPGVTREESAEIKAAEGGERRAAAGQ